MCFYFLHVSQQTIFFNEFAHIPSSYSEIAYRSNFQFSFFHQIFVLCIVGSSKTSSPASAISGVAISHKKRTAEVNGMKGIYTLHKNKPSSVFFVVLQYFKTWPNRLDAPARCLTILKMRLHSLGACLRILKYFHPLIDRSRFKYHFFFNTMARRCYI